MSLPVPHWSRHCSRRFAVRMPNGELYCQPADPKMAEYAQQYYAMPSFMRDVYGLVEPKSEPATKSAIFDTRAEAEALYARLAKQAAEGGVANWGGSVVEAPMAPFATGDPGVQFAAEVAEWIAQQGGAQ